MQDTQQQDAVDVLVGVDVGKGQHHAVALDRNGQRLYNKALPNDEAKLRALLTQIHPALERVLGPRLDHPAVLDLLERYPSPAALAGTSEKTLANRLTKLAPRMGKGLAAEIVQALSEQAVTVPGTQAATSQAG